MDPKTISQCVVNAKTRPDLADPAITFAETMLRRNEAKTRRCETMRRPDVTAMAYRAIKTELRTAKKDARSALAEYVRIRNK